MRAAVTPAVEVHPADIALRQNRAFDPGHDLAKRRRVPGWHIGERVEVVAAGQPHRARQAAADRRVQGPQVITP